MHNYGILKREGISIDNSVIKGSGANPYDKEFINSVAKYAEGVTIPFSNINMFINGINYSIQKNKFVPTQIFSREPRVLLSANTTNSFLPRYSVSKVSFNTIIKTYDTNIGEELCIIHEDILNIKQNDDITVTRTMNLDDGMMASFVILKKDNQTITLNESL
jgi:hypothetical protein